MKEILMKKPVLIAILVTIFLGFWALQIKDRSPMENLLTDEGNWIVQGQRYVDTKIAKRFLPTDPALYLATTHEHGWAQTLCNFEQYASTFGTVLGLCTTPYFYLERSRDPIMGDEVDVVHDEKPFIVDGKTPDNWRERLKKNLVLKSLTVDNANYVLTAVFLPDSESELAQAERAVKIAQMGKGISWYDIFDLDVHSMWRGITATGWMTGRYLIHVMLVASTMQLSIFGIGIVLLLGFRSVFGNWRLAWIAVFHIWAALICQMGAMALFGIHRSVFTLAAQMIPFLIGTSAMPEVFEKRGHARNPYLWASSIAIIGFLTLLLPYFGFEVKHVQEFAITGVLGVVFMTLFSLYSFPCFFRKSDIPEHVTNSWINAISEFIARKLNTAATWCSYGIRPYILALGIISMFLGSIWLVASGEIKTATDSRVYIKNTSVADGLDILDRPGGPGHVFIEILLECREEKTFNDPSCAREMILWHRAVEERFAQKNPELRTTFSMVKEFEEVAVGTEKSPGIVGRLPETKADVAAVWPTIKSRLSRLDQNGRPTYQSELWCDDDSCFRVILGLSVKTDAEQNRIITALDRFNKENFPNLKGTFYGKNALFSQLGQYVTEGKVRNNFASTLAVGIMFFIFLTAIQIGRVRTFPPIKSGLVAMVPFLFAPSLFLVLLWIGGNALDVVAATVSGFAIAAAGDFMVLLMYALVDNIKKYPEMNLYDIFDMTVKEQGRLRVRDMFLNVGSFLVFALCVLFEPVQMLGVAMMLITFLCLIGTLVFSTAFIYWMLRPVEVTSASISMEALNVPD